jgi:hypothetical protein
VVIGGGHSRRQPSEGRLLGAVGEIDWSSPMPGLPSIGAQDGKAAVGEDEEARHGCRRDDFFVSASSWYCRAS